MDAWIQAGNTTIPLQMYIHFCPKTPASSVLSDHWTDAWSSLLICVHLSSSMASLDVTMWSLERLEATLMSIVIVIRTTIGSHVHYEVVEENPPEITTPTSLRQI